jgi:hypothetical protein
VPSDDRSDPADGPTSDRYRFPPQNLENLLKNQSLGCSGADACYFVFCGYRWPQDRKFEGSALAISNGLFIMLPTFLSSVNHARDCFLPPQGRSKLQCYAVCVASIAEKNGVPVSAELDGFSTSTLPPPTIYGGKRFGWPRRLNQLCSLGPRGYRIGPSVPFGQYERFRASPPDSDGPRIPMLLSGMYSNIQFARVRALRHHHGWTGVLLFQC